MVQVSEAYWSDAFIRGKQSGSVDGYRGLTFKRKRTRRIWMLDRHTDVINAATRQNLGGWIRGRLKHGVEAREKSANEDLSTCKHSVLFLREQWSQQRAAQLSVKNRKCFLF